MDHETSVRMVRGALEDSLEHHFVSDVPVGIFLSGGLDSTALVALATHAGRRDLSTFCISAGNSAMDEAGVARRTARHFGTTHFESRIEASKGKPLLHEFLQRMDQPTIDGFNTFCVSKEAHEHGAKVVLSGLGADELSAGYSSFDRVPRMMRWSRWLNLVKPLRLAGGHSLERQSASPKFRRLGNFLGGKSSSKAAYRAVRGVFTSREALTIARQYLDGIPISASESDMVEPDLPPQPSLRDEVSYLEITRYMGNQLLRDSDVMSMAWGLELRVPYVDRRLVEIVSQIPARHRLVQGKKLLQDAVPELPDWVKGQPKRGFSFPFAEWIAEEWSDVFEGIDRASLVPLGSWYRRWSILALENCLNRLGLFETTVSRIR
jgi:asparagine synthase (glutamine-hydrolysing)